MNLAAMAEQRKF